MQLMPSLVFLGITTLSITVFWLLPMINVHIALNRERLLVERAQAMVDSFRVNRALLGSNLEDLNIAGLQINSVYSFSRGDYVVYDIDFNHTSFFYNKFLTRDDLESAKHMHILADAI